MEKVKVCLTGTGEKAGREYRKAIKRERASHILTNNITIYCRIYEGPFETER
jgi:hypothetical protein